MVSDVPVDDEAPVVTSGIFRSAGAQSFGGAHRGRVCVRVFIGCECACVLWASSLYCVILKKRKISPICGSEQKEDQLFLHDTVCDYSAIVSSATKT